MCDPLSVLDIVIASADPLHASPITWLVQDWVGPNLKKNNQDSLILFGTATVSRSGPAVTPIKSSTAEPFLLYVIDPFWEPLQTKAQVTSTSYLRGMWEILGPNEEVS